MSKPKRAKAPIPKSDYGPFSIGWMKLRHWDLGIGVHRLAF